jgi:histidine ammonia-lyase
MDTIFLDGAQLTIDQVIAVAYGAPGAPEIRLTADASQRVTRAAQAVQQLIDDGVVAYGITTGFGAFKDRIIPAEEVAQLQRNIVMSHAVGVGAPFDRATTRAILLIRANTLARGHSGVRLATLELLLELLNRGVHPVIPQKGSLGASGDLAPLAHMALVLIGMGEAEVDGAVLIGAAALAAKGLAPATLAAKEGLALTNGTAVMAALGTLEAWRARALSRVADIAGSLSLEALHGTPLAFDARIHALRPFPRQINCAAYLRELLAGSEFTRHADPTNVQDAYTLRCIPQVHGAVRDAIAYARWAMEIELNSVTDNPLLFIDATTGAIEVLSGGNFHGEPLAIAMDYLGMAMAELGNIAERRLMRLTDEASNAHVLPAFLTQHGGLNSGFMNHAVHGGRTRHRKQGAGASGQRRYDPDLGQCRGSREHGRDRRAETAPDQRQRRAHPRHRTAGGGAGDRLPPATGGRRRAARPGHAPRLRLDSHARTLCHSGSGALSIYRGGAPSGGGW